MTATFTTSSELADQEAALRAKLAKVTQARREEDERRQMIVGRVVLKRAEADDAAAAELRRMLDETLVKTRERRLFGLADKRPDRPAAGKIDTAGAATS